MSGELDEALAVATRLMAEKMGGSLTSEQLAAIAQRAATVLADLITGALEKKVKADEDAAVAGITTLEEAEQSAKKR